MWYIIYNLEYSNILYIYSYNRMYIKVYIYKNEKAFKNALVLMSLHCALVTNKWRMKLDIFWKEKLKKKKKKKLYYPSEVHFL